MNPLPSPQQLRYLLALVELDHFGRAAEACAVTQSTLSAGILALERQLDAAILDRGAGKHVVFTALGKEIVARARRALAALEAVAEAAAAARAPLSGPLRMGVIPTVGPFLLPQLMPVLRGAFPNLRLFVREDVTKALVDRLAGNQLGLLLVALPCECGDADTLAVSRDEFMVALPKGHRLGARAGGGAGGGADPAAGGWALPARPGAGAVRRGGRAGRVRGDQSAHPDADGGRRSGGDVAAPHGSGCGGRGGSGCRAAAADRQLGLAHDRPRLEAALASGRRVQGAGPADRAARLSGPPRGLRRSASGSLSSRSCPSAFGQSRPVGLRQRRTALAKAFLEIGWKQARRKANEEARRQAIPPVPMPCQAGDGTIRTDPGNGHLRQDHHRHRRRFGHWPRHCATMRFVLGS